jgi:general nucleoside transport system permease protein
MGALNSSGPRTMHPNSIGILMVAAALLGAVIRGSIPYMFVSLGECLTEKSGRINLGMEGILLMSAMTAFAISQRSGSPWLGALAAAIVGGLLGLLHAGLTELPGVNDIAAGIAMVVFGSGLAFFFGKQFVAPMAPQLPVLEFGAWTSNPALRAALRISPLFFLGIVTAFALHYAFQYTRWGLHIRAVGDAPEAARSMGISARQYRVIATTIGATLAGIGGSHLTLYFPGIWSEGISGGQGLMAVALVIFARWSPLRCLAVSLFFGGAQALGPLFQSLGFTGFYQLFNASPYVLTLVLMIASCSRSRNLAGMPGALGGKG